MEENGMNPLIHRATWPHLGTALRMIAQPVEETIIQALASHL